MPVFSLQAVAATQSSAFTDLWLAKFYIWTLLPSTEVTDSFGFVTSDLSLQYLITYKQCY